MPHTKGRGVPERAGGSGALLGWFVFMSKSGSLLKASPSDGAGRERESEKRDRRPMGCTGACAEVMPYPAIVGDIADDNPSCQCEPNTRTNEHEQRCERIEQRE